MFFDCAAGFRSRSSEISGCCCDGDDDDDDTTAAAAASAGFVGVVVGSDGRVVAATVSVRFLMFLVAVVLVGEAFDRSGVRGVVVVIANCEVALRWLFGVLEL